MNQESSFSEGAGYMNDLQIFDDVFIAKFRDHIAMIHRFHNISNHARSSSNGWMIDG